ncbi:MAG: hypothetical protein F4X44_12905 [Gammaproteobacteria bacterium]|nr:hypothetical protein [Gammaproteobacteria bacterium]MYD81496.1 hypothetical protein [Gammaproteobacteria bacterium]
MSVRIARLFGWYLITVALAVGVHFIVEFLYDSPPFTPHRIWFILDWFSLVGFLACIVAHFRYKESVRDRQEAVWEKISSNAAFYLSIALALAFIHNFVGSLAGGNDDLLFWKFINAIQVPLFAATGWKLSNEKELESGETR